MPVHENIRARKRGSIGRNAVAIGKVAFDLEIELFGEFPGHIDPGSAQTETIPERRGAEPSFERLNIAILEVHLNESTEHQLNL